MVGPEAIKPQERLVHPAEFIAVDPANRLYIPHMFLVEIAHHAVDLAAQRREADAHRTAINARTLMVKIA